jgi:hypothetical protein
VNVGQLIINTSGINLKVWVLLPCSAHKEIDMSRMQELMAAKADGQVLTGTTLVEMLARGPADEGVRTTTDNTRQRQVELG